MADVRCAVRFSQANATFSWTAGRRRGGDRRRAGADKAVTAPVIGWSAGRIAPLWRPERLMFQRPERPMFTTLALASSAHMRLEQIGSHLVAYGSQWEVVDAVARGE